MCAQVSDAEGRKWLGQESQRTRTFEETVTIFQALSGQRRSCEVNSTRKTATQCSWLHGTKSRTLLHERWLRSCCGADDPAMLVNSGVLGSDQGVDGEEYRDVAVQLQEGSWQIHHQGPQGRKDVVHVCVLTVRSLAAIPTLGSGTAPGHHMATPDVLTGRSVHARLREVPVDYEARRQAADGRCGERSAKQRWPLRGAECSSRTLLDEASAGLQPGGRSREETSSERWC